MFSEAAERNKGAILETLQGLLDRRRRYQVLEIGSGTGQHAAWFAANLPQVNWHPSDVL
ncbi:MAG: DUF938 domain-containing protein, partial [Gammaproteobacteria bacterium]|nr:DUF938 domain-containing protein [Gammaproteobacteria bacterium]